MRQLAEEIIREGITKVSLERFETIIRHFDKINAVEGDIIECGVWKGGMGVFLSKIFENRTIWLADSYQGFENQKTSTYFFKDENHHEGPRMVAPLQIIQDSLKKFGLEEGNRIKFLKGFVKDTLPDAGIGTIALLRVDVDAYSATRDVLDNLYDKVQKGGYIIFDDTSLNESRAAIKDFIQERGISFTLLHPETDKEVNLNTGSLPSGCYTIKQ
jgi:O-methyltransferase